MSSDIVKQGLELFNDQIKLHTELHKGESRCKQKSKKINDGMKLINSNKRGVWKQLRQLQKEYSTETKKKKKFKQKRCKLEEYRVNVDKDHTNSNIKLFKQISHVGKVKSAYCKKILEQHQIKLAKDIPKAELVEPDSVFTDRDFDQFEQEYDFFQKLQ